MSSSPPGDTHGDVQQALLQAISSILAPLSRLAVANGLPYAAVEEALKKAIVDAAADAHPQVPAHRNVSRISTATGLNRREVTRLTRMTDDASRAPRSFATEVFARWISGNPWRDRHGLPRVLPRTGPSPSFEALAQSITRDVHPRSLLDELLRLKLATLDEQADTVALSRQGFVPAGDRARLLGFLSENVGDHLGAAVDNVLGDSRRHFEQAIFADGLSDDSVQQLRQLIAPQWKALVEALVPMLEARVAADAELPPQAQRRVRIGLFTFDDLPVPKVEPPSAARAPRLSRRSASDTPVRPRAKTSKPSKT